MGTEEKKRKKEGKKRARQQGQGKRFQLSSRTLWSTHHINRYNRSWQSMQSERAPQMSCGSSRDVCEPREGRRWGPEKRDFLLRTDALSLSLHVPLSPGVTHIRCVDASPTREPRTKRTPSWIQEEKKKESESASCTMLAARCIHHTYSSVAYTRARAKCDRYVLFGFFLSFFFFFSSCSSLLGLGLGCATRLWVFTHMIRVSCG